MADAFDVAVLDQWGVLHDGTNAYPDAREAVERLRAAGKRIAILSNSGKRAALNAERIRATGIHVETRETVTSGEALRDDVEAGRLAPFSAPYAIEGKSGDANAWAKGMGIAFASRTANADALLVMGIPEGSGIDRYEGILADALARGLPLVCSNPDRASPRAGGRSQPQPGALAHLYGERGGTVHWYGKPHRPVFRAVERLNPNVPPERHMMVGDSPEHDIAGGAAAGWRTCLVRGGLHATELQAADDNAVRALCERHGAPPPDAHIALLA